MTTDEARHAERLPSIVLDVGWGVCERVRTLQMPWKLIRVYDSNEWCCRRCTTAHRSQAQSCRVLAACVPLCVVCCVRV